MDGALQKALVLIDRLLLEKGGISVNCTEAYKEHIEYTFNAFCRVVIHYAAINAWRDRDKRRQREISFEYLTEEKFYPFCTSDTYFIDPYKQYPVTIFGQRWIVNTFLDNFKLLVFLAEF